METFNRTATTLSIKVLMQAQLIALRAPQKQLKSRRTYKLRYQGLQQCRYKLPLSIPRLRLPAVLMLAS